VHLLSKNRICLKEPDKVDFERDIFSKAGYLAEKRTLHFKNQILTSAKTLTTEAITCNDRFLLFLGMKSSGK
jgi:hypothetical protein